MKRKITKGEKSNPRQATDANENNCSPPACPQAAAPSPTCPQLYIPRMTSHGMGHPIGQLRSAVPAASPPSFPCSPSPLAGGARNRKCLDRA